MKYLTEIADDLEVVVQWVLKSPERYGEMRQAIKAAERVEAFLATYQEQEKDV